MPLASALDGAGQTTALALVDITDPSADLVVSVDTPAAYDAVLACAGVNGIEVVFESRAAGIVTLSRSGGPDGFVSNLASLPGVLSVSSERKARVLFTPNDPHITYQWALAKVSAYEAWDIAQGNKSTVVAVLDTGIDWNHPDIGPNIWSDEDGYHGYNFIADNRIPMDDNIHSYDANGVWLPNTYTYHGTHVAGVVGAVTDNGLGMAGIAQVSLMAVKVMNESGEGTDSTVASGVRWAVDHGADVITMSLGVDGPSTVLQREILYASRNGVVMVAASGNSGTSYVSYPAAYPQVIAVGATDSADRRASFSNFGTDLDLMAPGVQIYSAQGDFGYQYLSGTSTAAPHVAGVAAIMVSINPALTAVEVGEVLNETARDISMNGYDTSTGWGIVNAFEAIEEVASPTLTFTEYPEYAKPNSTYSVTWMVSGGNPGVISSTYVAWGESPTSLTQVSDSFAGITWALFTVDDLPALEANGSMYLQAYAVVDGTLYVSPLLEMPVHEPQSDNFLIQFLIAVEDFILNDIGLVNFLIMLGVLIVIPVVVYAARPKRRAPTTTVRQASASVGPLQSYDALPGSQYIPPPPPPPRYEAYVDLASGQVSPPSVKIVEGTKVVWVNRSWAPPPGIMIRSGRLDETGEHPDGLFQSGLLIAPGDYWSCQFHRVGSFDYYITGLWKRGRIVVESYSAEADSASQGRPDAS